MKHIIRLKQVGGKCDVKYRRKWYRFNTIQEARNKANEILYVLFFSGIPADEIDIRND